MVLLAGPVRAAELPPAQYGHGLMPQKTAAGWISLFDGATTFGWTGARVDSGRLIGGQTATQWMNYEILAEVAGGGAIRLGEKELSVQPGVLCTRIEGPQRPIVLGPGVSVRVLAVRPLGLAPIFNGKDLDGWKLYHRPYVKPQNRAVWTVEDGMLHAFRGQGSLEYQGRQFGDFVLQLEVFCRSDEANSGIFFRNMPGECMMGYEAQILNRCKAGDPAQPQGYGTGGIDDRMPTRRLVSRDRQWFLMTVFAAGPHLAVWVNGYQTADWIDTREPHDNPRQGLRTKSGTIQIQAHDPKTDILLRAVRIAPLD